tara:strand:+ start:118 stop:867 length:750 start_codon:yes stop_codon:yes gene_type:complete
MIYKRKVKGIVHKAYDTEKEFRQDHPNTPIVSDWRIAKEGEWCHTDDSKIVQVLKRNDIGNNKQKYLRTIIGMFLIRSDYKLSGTIKNEMYRFARKNGHQLSKDSAMTNKKRLFAKYVAYGMKPEEAYKKAYPDTTSETYIKQRSFALLQNKTVRQAVDKEVEQLMSEVGITKRYLLENTKDIVDKRDTRDNDKLRAIETLMKISGMLSTEKKVDSVALIQEFTGFTKEKLKAFEQGILPETKKELSDG